MDGDSTTRLSQQALDSFSNMGQTRDSHMVFEPSYGTAVMAFSSGFPGPVDPSAFIMHILSPEEKKESLREQIDRLQNELKTLEEEKPKKARAECLELE